MKTFLLKLVFTDIKQPAAATSHTDRIFYLSLLYICTSVSLLKIVPETATKNHSLLMCICVLLARPVTRLRQVTLGRPINA